MRAAALLSLTLPAADPEAVRRWWAETLQLPEEDGDLFVGDLPLRFGSGLAVRVVSPDVEQETTVTDPAGTAVVVAPPDRAEAERAEESIRSFVEQAGGSVPGVADAVEAVAREAQARVHELVAALPNNDRIAVHLELGQRARTQQAAMPWHLHAASMLTSGTFGPDT